MKVTGYMFKEALKMHSLTLSTVQTQFDESLHIFEGDSNREHPKSIVDKIRKLEHMIATLQTGQSEYNLAVQVKVGDKDMPLELAIKLVGGAGRISKMWRSASKGRVRDRWDSSRIVSRNKDEEIAQPTITKNDALEEAIGAEKFALRLRSAISTGNTVEAEISSLDPGLFD